MTARWLVLIAALLTGPLLAEGFVRAAIIWPDAFPEALVRTIRDPGRYFDDNTDDYWKLEEMWSTFTPLPVRWRFDPELGWVDTSFANPQRLHATEFEVGDRQVILLFGASYASCVSVRQDDCFQGLLESTTLGDHYVLINYGVYGYGAGQTLMLMRQVLDRYADRHPIVVIGLGAETDFHRAPMGVREWCKPRFSADGGRLHIDPPCANVADYLEASPPRVPSFAWRLFEGPEPLDSARNRRVTELIVDAMVDEVARRDLEVTFWLFHVPSVMRKGTHRAGPLRRLLESRGVTYVDSGDAFERAQRLHPNAPPIYMAREGDQTGVHPTKFGNAIALNHLFAQRFGGGATVATDLALAAWNRPGGPPWHPDCPRDLRSDEVAP